MLRRIALLGLALLLSACETMQVSHDYNPAVDFAQFRTWAWKDPAVQYQPNNPMLRSDLTEQRIVQAVSSQLDQRGLRPVAAGSKPDLLVQTWLIVANRQEQVVTNYGYGGPWGGPWGVTGAARGKVTGAHRCITKPATWSTRLVRCRST